MVKPCVDNYICLFGDGRSFKIITVVFTCRGVGVINIVLYEEAPPLGYIPF